MFVNNFFKIFAMNGLAGAAYYNDYGECLALNGASRRICAQTSMYNGLGEAMKTVKTSLSVTGSGGGAASPYGILFGNGSAPVTANDYKLSGSLITNIQTTYKFTFTPDKSGYSVSTLYTITNTSSANSITISEVALVFRGYYCDSSGGSIYSDSFLVERTLLDTPITIAPNGVGQVTYTIRINYPVL